MPRGRRHPLTLSEAAAAIGLSVPTLRRHIRSGRLRADRIRGKFGVEYRIAPRALAALGLPVRLPPPRRDKPARSADGPARRAMEDFAAELSALREDLRALRKALVALTSQLARTPLSRRPERRA